MTLCSDTSNIRGDYDGDIGDGGSQREEPNEGKGRGKQSMEDDCPVLIVYLLSFSLQVIHVGRENGDACPLV